MVEDRASHVGPGEHLKGDAFGAVVQLGCPDQTQQADLAEVLQGLLAVVGVVAGKGLHQVAIGDDAAVAFPDRRGTTLGQA
jgi:hypothetical protein